MSVSLCGNDGAILISNTKIKCCYFIYIKMAQTYVLFLPERPSRHIIKVTAVHKLAMALIITSTNRDHSEDVNLVQRADNEFEEEDTERRRFLATQSNSDILVMNSEHLIVSTSLTTELEELRCCCRTESVKLHARFPSSVCLAV